MTRYYYVESHEQNGTTTYEARSFDAANDAEAIARMKDDTDASYDVEPLDAADVDPSEVGKLMRLPEDVEVPTA